MKVGDVVYTTAGVLRMGTIVEHNTDVGFYVVQFDDNTRQAFAPCSVHGREVWYGRDGRPPITKP